MEISLFYFSNKKQQIEIMKSISFSLFYSIKNRVIDDEIMYTRLLQRYISAYNECYNRNLDVTKLILTPIPFSSLPSKEDEVFVFDIETNQELYDAIS